MSDESAPFPSIPGYRIVSSAGKGTFASRWDAVQDSLDRPVRIETLAEEFLPDARKAARFEELGRAIAKVGGPCFIPVIDVGHTADGVPYVAMDLPEGHFLSELVAPGRPLEPARAARIVMRVAAAFDEAWSRTGFVHRNLKPSNLAVDAFDAVTITGFLAGTFAGPGLDPCVCDDGLLVGSPSYMAPEQTLAASDLDFRADVYALGATFYQLLTGVAPFADECDPLAVCALQRSGTIPSPTVVNPDVPSAFSEVVRRMMAKRPADRPSSWAATAELVRRALEGHAPPERATTADDSPLSTVEAVPCVPSPSRSSRFVAGATSASAVSSAVPAPTPRATSTISLLVGLAALSALVGFATWFFVLRHAAPSFAESAPAVPVPPILSEGSPE